MNLLNASLDRELDSSSDLILLRSGSATIELEGSSLPYALGLVGSAPFVVGIRPEHVHLADPGQGIRATVKLVEMLGSESLVHLDVEGIDRRVTERDSEDNTATGGGRILCKVHDLQAVPSQGENVGVLLDRNRLHLFDAQSGEVLPSAPPNSVSVTPPSNTEQAS